MNKLSKLFNFVGLLRDKNKAKLFVHQYQNKDGNKIYLQEMMHIAPTKFYEHVNQNIKNFIFDNDKKSKSSLILIEGIKNNVDENKFNGRDVAKQLQEIIAKLMFLDKDVSLSETYESFAYGLNWDSQKKDKYILNIDNEQLIRADVFDYELLDLLIERNIIHQINHKNSFFKNIPRRLLRTKDKLQNSAEKIKNSSVRQRFLRAIIRNAIISDEEQSGLLFNLMKYQKTEQFAALFTFMDVILKERNKVLIDYIKKHHNEANLFITYGKMHFVNRDINSDYSIHAALRKLGYELIDDKQIFFEI